MRVQTGGWWIYILGMTLSLILSWWINSQETVINPDAICYLLSAATVGSSGIHAAMHLCPQANWPLYAVLIHALQKVLPFSYETTAYLIDAIFTALSVGLFVRIVKELGASRLVSWLALFTILFAHEFNSVRQYIIRDHGFWAFYLASLLFLLQYLHRPRMLVAFCWSGSLMLATLFRIEGAFFLLALPFATIFIRDAALMQRVYMFLSLQALTMLAALALLAWFMLHPQESLQKMGRLAEIKEQLLHGVAVMHGRYQAAKLGMAQHVLDANSARDAGPLLFIMLLGMYVLYVVTNLSVGYALLVVYGWLRRVYEWSTRSRLVLVSYILINVVITFGFLFEQFFLSKRYLIALSLLFMLAVPFALADLLKRVQQRQYRFFGMVVLLLILASSISGVINFGYSKQYLREAGDWMATQLPKGAALYTNDYQLFYYVQHERIGSEDLIQRYRAIQSTNWNQYEYVALRVGYDASADEQSILQNKALQKMNEFRNKRGDRVIVYHVTGVSHEEKTH